MTDLNEQEAREAVAREAITWQGTPYHLNARLKGVGVDCGTFIAACFEAVDLVPPLDLGTFAPDFNLHRGGEVYREWLLKFCVKVDRTPLPGDIVLYRYGRIDSHAAIVLVWPRVVHAHAGAGVIEGDGEDPTLKSRQTGVYSFWR